MLFKIVIIRFEYRITDRKATREFFMKRGQFGLKRLLYTYNPCFVETRNKKGELITADPVQIIGRARYFFHDRNAYAYVLISRRMPLLVINRFEIVNIGNKQHQRTRGIFEYSLPLLFKAITILALTKLVSIGALFKILDEGSHP